MGQAFSGPNAFAFLHLTPEATAVLRAKPILFVELVIVLISLHLMVLLAWYIHFVTNKAYKKPKSEESKPGTKKKTLKAASLAPWVSRLRT